MSSISSIGNAQSMALSSYKIDELSTSTKMKLEALGIDPSSVTSEAQAQQLIKQAEATKHQQNSQQQQQGGNSSEQQLISEAKELAAKVGVTVSTDDTLDDITGNIADKIQAMMDTGDPSKIKTAQEYQTQLARISDEADSITNTQQNIFNAMDMISVSNKYALGLQ